MADQTRQSRHVLLKFLIDECLHFALAIFAREHGHEAYHVNWLGLAGTADWNLMTHIVDEDFIFVTNNARDFRRLYAREPLHAGLVIIVPQVAPLMQTQLFDAILVELDGNQDLVNEVIEIAFVDGTIAIDRYSLHEDGG